METGGDLLGKGPTGNESRGGVGNGGTWSAEEGGDDESHGWEGIVTGDRDVELTGKEERRGKV